TLVPLVLVVGVKLFHGQNARWASKRKNHLNQLEERRGWTCDGRSGAALATGSKFLNFQNKIVSL
ncbi:hypothetical protein PIB30_066994, partial [Stylosanthes scabra]|nr:hypothetical protein [Stylosanthes scabra]